jgi:hypothetical protein
LLSLPECRNALNFKKCAVGWLIGERFNELVELRLERDELLAIPRLGSFQKSGRSQ